MAAICYPVSTTTTSSIPIMNEVIPDHIAIGFYQLRPRGSRRPWPPVFDTVERIPEHIAVGFYPKQLKNVDKVSITKHGKNNNNGNSKDDDEEEVDSCAICLCEYELENKKKIETVMCGHKYHKDCIKAWLLLNNACPMCRATVSTTA